MAAGVIRQWGPRLSEIDREAKHCGVAVPNGVEDIGLRESTYCTRQATGSSSLILQRLQCRRTGDRARRWAPRWPALTPFVVECYGENPKGRVKDPGEPRKVGYSSGKQQEDPRHPEMLHLPLRPGSKHPWTAIKPEGVES